MVFGEVSYAEPPPLQLGTAQKECPRRDSLSSSRTGDSGYLSDVEMGLSPLEVCSPWQCRCITLRRGKILIRNGSTSYVVGLYV